MSSENSDAIDNLPMRSENSVAIEYDLATINLIGAERMVHDIGIEIDRYESRLSQTNWFIHDTKKTLDNLKREKVIEYNVQSEGSAVRMYSADLIRDWIKKIDIQQPRLVALLENAGCLDNRIKHMKKQKTVYEGRVSIAATGWRVACRNAQEHATMQSES